MVTSAQQSSPATALPMLMIKKRFIAFYDELSSLVYRIMKHNVPVIGGVMNVQIGKNLKHKFSLLN